MRLSATFQDCYTAALFAGLAATVADTYLVSLLAGLVALSWFRIQRLFRNYKRARA